MKSFTVYINEKLKITKDVLKQGKYNYHPKTKNELKELTPDMSNEEKTVWKQRASRISQMVQ